MKKYEFMVIQSMKRAERISFINGNKYVIYKIDGVTFIELDGEVVFSSKIDKLSASQWLKAKKL